MRVYKANESMPSYAIQVLWISDREQLLDIILDLFQFEV